MNLENKVGELNDLLHAFKMLNSDLDLQEVLNNILNQMVGVVKAEAGTLWLLNEENQVIEAVAVKGPVSEVVFDIKMQLNEGIVGKVVGTGVAELIEDVSKHSDWSKRVDDDSGFETKSMITVPLIAKGKVLGALQLINKQEVSFFTDGDINLALTLSNQSALALHNSQMYDELNRMFLSMVRTLVKTLDARDPYTAGHSERVAKYSVWIAERMGFEQNMLDELYKAALMHDIGKIGIPDAILLKRSKLTDEEFDVIKQHTVIGASILSHMEPKSALQYAVHTARSHHEKMNGKGYPDGLVGNEIPLFARIVGVTDAFDAMTTVRPYSNGLSYELAKEELIRCKDFIFDGEIVDVFANIIEEKNHQLDERWAYDLI